MEGMCAHKGPTVLVREASTVRVWQTSTQIDYDNVKVPWIAKNVQLGQVHSIITLP